MQRHSSHGHLLALLLSAALALHLCNAFLTSSHQNRHHQSTTTSVAFGSADINTTNRRRLHYNLTILIPAYNEIDRIGETLGTYINYMKHQPVYQHSDDTILFEQQTTITGQCSILVVDDGSTDGTCQYITEKRWLDVPNDNNPNDVQQEVCTNCWKVDDHVACISLPTNQGKGAAIARGMMELPQCCAETNEDDAFDIARSIVLVADADGSGDISCLDDMIHSLECLLESSSSSSSSATITDDLAIIVGKRKYPQSKKSRLRSILSWGFRTCVSTLFIGTNTNNTNNKSNRLGVTDTQCGF